MFVELFVKLLGDFFNIECGTSSPRHIYDGKCFLFFNRDRNLFQTLNERFTGLAYIETLLTNRKRLALLATHPLPYLLSVYLVCENNKVFTGGFCNLIVNLQAY